MQHACQKISYLHINILTKMALEKVYGFDTLTVRKRTLFFESSPNS